MTTNTLTVTLGGEILVRLAPPEPPSPVPVITVRHANVTFTAKGTEMALTLPVTDYIDVQIAYVDAHGNPATVDGEVVWSAEPAASMVLEPQAGDSTICRITPAGQAGYAQVTATADADLGEGVRSLVTLLDVTMIAGEAFAGTITPLGPSTPIP